MIFLLVCRSCLSVSAYTDLNGYAFVMTNMVCQFYQQGEIWNPAQVGTLKEQNSYFFDFPQAVDHMAQIRFGKYEESLLIPLNLDVYDYYVVGTVAFTNCTTEQFKGFESAYFLSFENTSDYRYVNLDGGLKTLDFANYGNVVGQSFYGKINAAQLVEASNLSYFHLNFSELLTFDGDVWFSASIVPVEKSAGTDAATAAIIQKLTEINTNQTNSNVLQQESNQIAQDTQQQIIQGNEIAQDQLEVEQEQADTQKSLLERITDFFGSFFENLINAVIGLFVPGEEEMAELFNQLNDFFADKFGFLYYPFELLTKVFNVLMTDSTSTAMTFPGITVLGYELCPAMEIDIAQNELVGDIFGHIRMITGGTMCFAFVNYLRTKFDKTVKS